MGQYKNGKWEPTFGDVNAGISDWAPGEGSFDTEAPLRDRIEELEAEKKKWQDKAHHQNVENLILRAKLKHVEALPIYKAFVRLDIDHPDSTGSKPIDHAYVEQRVVLYGELEQIWNMENNDEQ